MAEDHHLYVPAELAGARLDRALAQLAGAASRRLAKEAIQAGAVAVAGRVVTDPRHAVAAGDAIAARLAAVPHPDAVEPAAAELAIHAEDEDYFIINKPAGMVMHPARGHARDTLANAVAALCPRAGALPRAGVVHRLDKDTSGLVAVARSEAARAHLQLQFKQRTITRHYWAIVHGQPPATGVVDRAIGRDRANRLRMAVSDRGREAVTRYEILATSKAYSLLQCRLESGRTHQIRVHLEHAGYPLAGDRQYRKHARAEGGVFGRQMLHARSLGFPHPRSGEQVEYLAPPPPDFLQVMQDVGLQAA